MPNSLDPDEAGQFVWPDLGPNCLPRLSADDTGRQKSLIVYALHMHIFLLSHACVIISATS